MYSIAKNFELIYYTDYANFNQPYPLYRQEFWRKAPPAV